MKEDKQRLDKILVEKGITPNRSQAQDLIKSGKVIVDGKVARKTGLLVGDENTIKIIKHHPYVSRAGLKLEHALKEFKLKVKDKTCLDVGSSTGGFTDCLLQMGAGKVYAVDVGYNQLHKKLKSNPQILSFEQTDIRDFEVPDGEKVEFICVDVSFISLKNIIPHLTRFASDGCDVVLLFKPQFEVGRQYLNKHGVVKDEIKIKTSMDEIIITLKENGFKYIASTISPIQGKTGNTEYLIYAKFEKD